MAVNLSKGQRVSLAKSGGGALTRVRMGLGWYNRNYVGTQFGGSLYSMTDPFFMLMIMENLGRNMPWEGE